MVHHARQRSGRVREMVEEDDDDARIGDVPQAQADHARHGCAGDASPGNCSLVCVRACIDGPPDQSNASTRPLLPRDARGRWRHPGRAPWTWSGGRPSQSAEAGRARCRPMRACSPANPHPSPRISACSGRGEKGPPSSVRKCVRTISFCRHSMYSIACMA